MSPRIICFCLTLLAGIPQLRAQETAPPASALPALPPLKPKIIEEPAPPPVRKARALPEDDAPAEGSTSSAEMEAKLRLKDPSTALRLQIFLDSISFGPGKIDGDIGEFTKKAAFLYNQVHGLPGTGWEPLLKLSEAKIQKPTTEYELKENDFRFLVPDLPETPSAQVEYRYLGYRTIDEFIAERYHTSEGFLAKMNPKYRFANAKAGDKVVVPNVATPFIIEEVPYSKSYDAEAPLSERRVLLDTKEKMASFYDEKGNLFACFPITPGRDKFIKPGEFELKKMITTPEFRYDKSMLDHGERSEDYQQLPPGPNSPVGIFWASTSRNGIGLHGTSTPHSIGRAQSAGCVRFANWDAVRLPELIRPGTKLVMR